MTEDEVFAEFYFETVVIPTWMDFPRTTELSDTIIAYYKLPGSKPFRLESFIATGDWMDRLSTRERISYER